MKTCETLEALKSLGPYIALSVTDVETGDEIATIQFKKEYLNRPDVISKAFERLRYESHPILPLKWN